jgi:hypothetical protein
MIELVSPIGHTRTQPQTAIKRLASPVGLRLGFIWNRYQTTRGFWPRLESAVEAVCKPASVEREYKPNTWMPLDQDRFGALLTNTDYLVVGVGA